MKSKITKIAAGVLALALLAPAAFAQADEGAKEKRKGKGKPAAERPEKPRGERSVDEIVKSIKTRLAENERFAEMFTKRADSDEDGKLSDDEIKAAVEKMGQRGQRGQRPRGDRPEGDRPKGPRGERSVDEIVKSIKARLAESESFAERFTKRADSDEDGKLSDDEIKAAVEKMGQRGQGPRGERPEGNRPKGPRGERPEGDRPKGPRGERPEGDRPKGPRGERPKGPRGEGKKKRPEVEL